MTDHTHAPLDGPAPSPNATAGSLTPRELELLALLATGATGPQISAALGIKVATVKTHLHNAYKKLGVTNRVAATRYYLAHLDPSAPPPAEAGRRPPATEGGKSLTQAELERRIDDLKGVSDAADRLRRRLEHLRTVPRA